MQSSRCSDDYGIACCVSYQEIGKQIQFFGARCNLAKTLLLALNEGRCEISGKQVINGIPALKSDVLDLDEVMENFKLAMQEVSRVYADSMNIIHYIAR
jgi:formate C-acetyltransferase